MWDRKYRPIRFAEVLGQEGSVRILKARLQNKSGLESSYIFSGGSGQGKTTLARILSRALLCENLVDEEPCNKCGNCLGILHGNSEAFVEQDAASRGSVDAVREIVDDLPFVVPGAKKRIYLFDEAHRMSNGAQDVLLKPIEEGKLVCMFCTTEPEKIRGPIQSRCEEYRIRKITREEISSRMVWVLEQEKVSYELDAVLTIIDYCSGHVRDILNRLEMISQLGPVTVQAVHEYLNLGVISTYYEILLSLGEPAKSVPLVEGACDRVGSDEVATGIAEAAMNSYRQAHGMYMDYALSDRKLGEQVFQLHGGEAIIHLADFFLRTYKPSRVSLVCDIIRCARGVPVSGTAPPVLVMAPPTSTPAAPRSSTAPAATPSPATSVTSAPTPAAAPPAALPPVNGATHHASEKFRSDGIGSLGSPDIQALTDLDHKVVKEALPRGAVRQQPEKKAKETEGVSLVELLPANQWRHEFEEAWLRSHNGA